MSACYLFLAAGRYWPESALLKDAYQRLCADMGLERPDALLSVDGEGLDELPCPPQGTLVIIPMSGAIQPQLLRVAVKYAQVILYAAYMRGNADGDTGARMLSANAAPTLMDCWAVLRRTHPCARLALDSSSLGRLLRVMQARQAVRGATLLLIGDTEPWVVSASRTHEDYARLGVAIRRIPLEELSALYQETTEAEGAPYALKYRATADDILEPSDADIAASGRMTAALLRLIESHGADGVAIACFHMLSLGVTACVAVSYVNDCTPYVAACEGDLDSACSMLIMKKLAVTKLWMANPGLHPGGVVNFSHCTAPTDIDGNGPCPFTLRSHHESGIGTSLQVTLPVGRRVTAFRVSGQSGRYTVQGGVSEEGAYEPACRTQLYVRFDAFDKYLRTALGCHQVLAFEDMKEELELLADSLGLNVEA